MVKLVGWLSSSGADQQSKANVSMQTKRLLYPLRQHPMQGVHTLFSENNETHPDNGQVITQSPLQVVDLQKHQSGPLEAHLRASSRLA